jgi:hypothetical protein
MNPWSFSRRVGYLSYSKSEARLPPNVKPRVGTAAKMPSAATCRVGALGERQVQDVECLKLSCGKEAFRLGAGPAGKRQ